MDTAMLEAIKSGDRDAVARLLDSDQDFLKARTDGGVSAISLSMYHGHPDIARLFIDRGADLDLFEAAATGELDRVRELATAENVNGASSDGFQPLGLACYFGHQEVAEFLLSLGADVNLPSANDMKVSPIHAATARRSEPIVRMLLQHAANPNARQQSGYTALAAARQNGDREIVELLLEYGATGEASGAHV